MLDKDVNHGKICIDLRYRRKRDNNTQKIYKRHKLKSIEINYESRLIALVGMPGQVKQAVKKPLDAEIGLTYSPISISECAYLEME